MHVRCVLFGDGWFDIVVLLFCCAFNLHFPFILYGLFLLLVVLNFIDRMIPADKCVCVCVCGPRNACAKLKFCKNYYFIECFLERISPPDFLMSLASLDQCMSFFSCGARESESVKPKSKFIVIFFLYTHKVLFILLLLLLLTQLAAMVCVSVRTDFAFSSIGAGG